MLLSWQTCCSEMCMVRNNLSCLAQAADAVMLSKLQQRTLCYAVQEALHKKLDVLQTKISAPKPRKESSQAPDSCHH